MVKLAGREPTEGRSRRERGDSAEPERRIVPPRSDDDAEDAKDRKNWQQKHDPDEDKNRRKAFHDVFLQRG